MGGGATWSNLLKNGVKLDEGYYMMVTGTRLASGAVLSNSTFFTIEPGKTTTVDLVMRESKDQVQVIGNFNSEATYRPVGGTDPKYPANLRTRLFCGCCSRSGAGAYQSCFKRYCSFAQRV